jgi:hypothetical protein
MCSAAIKKEQLRGMLPLIILTQHIMMSSPGGAVGGCEDECQMAIMDQNINVHTSFPHRLEHELFVHYQPGIISGREAVRVQQFSIREIK